MPKSIFSLSLQQKKKSVKKKLSFKNDQKRGAEHPTSVDEKDSGDNVKTVVVKSKFCAKKCSKQQIKGIQTHIENFSNIGFSRTSYKMRKLQIPVLGVLAGVLAVAIVALPSSVSGQSPSFLLLNNLVAKNGSMTPPGQVSNKIFKIIGVIQ